MMSPLLNRLPELPGCRLLRMFFSIIFFIGSALPAQCQKNQEDLKVRTSIDTIFVKKGTPVLLLNNIYWISKDTLFTVRSIEIPTIQSIRIKRSNTFYDSVYEKLSRKKFTQMLYTLAFKEPDQQTLPGSVDKIRSESLFVPFKGKVIRRIRIVTLDPFGTSTLDTLKKAQTGIGAALNKVHVQTRTFVIRKNLFIKEGDTIDPFILAENEKNIREMPFINNVYTLVTCADSTCNSADVTIITKDVWSIGFDVTSATTSKTNVSIYDGNFLGVDDRISMNISAMFRRAPFSRVDGASYTYNNIAGTFLNSQVNYSTDDLGNQAVGGQLNRSFYSNKTKWAGGVGFQYNKMVYPKGNTKDEPEPEPDISYFDELNLWAGRAFQLKNIPKPTRFVITESFYHREFTSRPEITIDMNKAYYNTTQLFTGFALSTNNYYLSDYFLQFGKTENVPYGKYFKVTLGPEMTDYYIRFYGSVDISAGNFVGGIGYFSGRTVLGGYYYQNSIEDAVVKVSIKYVTPLFLTPNKKFRFRSYLFSDYRYGFNFRKNNLDYTNINSDLKIEKVKFDTIFHGLKSLSANLSLVMYTPLYFYGFKFAFTMHLEGGFVSGEGESLFSKSFYSGLGLGILVHNDNLIFPTFLLSGFYYPAAPAGVPWDQYRFDQNANITLPDYNVTMPGAESLQK